MALSTKPELQQEKAVEFIRDWSKWLIGLNFTSGTGCVVVLQQGVNATTKLFLVSAILSFGFSSILSVLLIAHLPGLIQLLPFVNRSGQPRSIYEFKAFRPFVSLRTLVIVQLLFFILGLAFLFTWIILKPVK